MYKTLSSPMAAARKGPTAAPIDPVPSMTEATVARALSEPARDLWVPSSADTAVVIREYGPLTCKKQKFLNEVWTLADSSKLLWYLNPKIKLED